MNENKEKIVYAITEGSIQEQAEDGLGRELTKSELDAVIDEIYEGSWAFQNLVTDSIEHFIDYNDMLDKNKDADKSPTYFKTYWKNTNAYQKDFKFSFAFKEKSDALKYIKSHFFSEYDQWKLTRVDKDGEFEVEVIGQGRVDY